MFQRINLESTVPADPDEFVGSLRWCAVGEMNKWANQWNNFVPSRSGSNLEAACWVIDWWVVVTHHPPLALNQLKYLNKDLLSLWLVNLGNSSILIGWWQLIVGCLCSNTSLPQVTLITFIKHKTRIHTYAGSNQTDHLLNLWRASTFLTISNVCSN